MDTEEKIDSASDNLRDSISSAIDTVTKTDAPVESDATDKPAEQATPRDTETGKFQKRDEKASGKAADKSADKSAKPVAKDDKQPDLPGTQLDKPAAKPSKAAPGEAPSDWQQKDRDMFAGQTPAAQEFILRRYKEMEAGATKKFQEASALARDAAITSEYSAVHQKFQPYEQMLRQRGLSPSKVIDGWMNVEQRFMSGDGLQALKDIAKAYNIDFGQVALPTPQAQTPDGKQVVLPPEVHQQLSELSDWKRAQQQREIETAASEQNRQMQAKVSEIDQFAEAKDAKGNLLHPYYAEVMEHMTQLAWGDRMAGRQPPPLERLYEIAVYANPDIRAKLIAAEAEAKQMTAQEAARAKAAKAKAAGASVTGSVAGRAAIPQRGNGAASLRDDIRSAIRGVEPDAA